MKRVSQKIISVILSLALVIGVIMPSHVSAAETTDTTLTYDFADATAANDFSSSSWSVTDGVFKANAVWNACQLTKVLPLNEEITVSFDFYIDYNGDWAGSLLGFGFMNADNTQGTFGWLQRSLKETGELLYGDLLTWKKDGINGPTSNTAVGDQIVRSKEQVAEGNSAFGSVHSAKIAFANGNMTVSVDGTQMSCTNGASLTCELSEGYFTLIATNTSAYIDNLTIEGLPSDEAGDDETDNTPTEADEMFGYYDVLVKSTSAQTHSTDDSGTLSATKQLLYWISNMSGAEYVAFDVNNSLGGAARVGAEMLMKTSGNSGTYGGAWTTSSYLDAYLIDDSTGKVTTVRMDATGYRNMGAVSVPNGFQGTVVFPIENFERSAYRHGSALKGFNSYDTINLSKIYRFDARIYKVSGETYTASSSLTTSNVRVFGRNLSGVSVSANRAIQAIKDIGNVTAASENLILFARETYDALTDEQKAQVTNYEVLTAAESAFANLTDYSGYMGTDGKDFTNTSGVTFNEVFDSAPSTVSAWIKVDKDTADTTHVGTIAGTLDKVGAGSGNMQGLYDSYNSFNFEVTTNGNLQVVWRVSESVRTNFLVDNVDVRTGDWMHVAMTRDVENNKLRVYVNGVLAQEKSVYAGTIANISMTKPVMVGSDYNDNNVLAPGEHPTFKGSIGGVNFYSTMLDADGIMQDIVGDKPTGLLGNVDISSGEEGVYFNEVGEDLIDAYGWKAVEDDYFTADDNEFTLAVFPDTQMLFSKAVDGAGKTFYQDGYDVTSNSFYKNVQWLIKNKELLNLQHVFHVGDITDNLNNSYATSRGGPELEAGLEWMSLLSDNDISWSLSRGNHDGGFSTTYQDLYDERYTYETYGSIATGSYKTTDMRNTYYNFEACGQKYMIVVLDIQPSDDEIAWANELIAANPDRRVIISTHAYMGASGAFITNPMTGDSNHMNTGDVIWEDLASQHANICMVICGHSSGTNIVKRQDTGVNGNTVYQYMIDESQMGFYGSYQPGTFALLKFADGGNTVDFNFYSASEGELFRSMNQFSVTLDGAEYVADAATSKEKLQSVELPKITEFQGTNNGTSIFPLATSTSTSLAMSYNNFGITNNSGYIYAVGFDVPKSGVFKFTDTSYIKTNGSAWMYFSVYVIDGATQETKRWFPKDNSNLLSSQKTGTQGEVKLGSYGYEYFIGGSSQSCYLSQIGGLRVNEGDKIIFAFRSGNTNYSSVAATITEDNGTVTTYDAIQYIMNSAGDATAAKNALQSMREAGWAQINEDGTPKNYHGWTAGWLKTTSGTSYTPYKYTLTVQDTDGSTISSRPAPVYTILPELKRTGKVFVGYDIDGALYPAGYVLNVTANTTIKAVLVDFTTFNSGSVRMKSPTGLRFSTQMDDTDYAYLQSLGLDLQFGSYIAMASSITTDGVLDYSLLNEDATFKKVNVKSTVQVTGQNNYMQFNSVVVGLKEDLYNEKFVGRGYVTVTYADGSSKTHYATVNDNSRSVAQVAARAVADVSKLQTKEYCYPVSGGYSPYSATNLAVLNGFANLYTEE